jgi:hypothetical protein
MARSRKDQGKVSYSACILIGTAQGTDANTAYRNLLAENPHL